MAFPDDRPRRLRRTQALRDLVSQTSLSPSDFILPIFVREGIADPEPIRSLPGVLQHTVESATKMVDEARSLGVRGVMVFGVPFTKDDNGSEAWNRDGIAQVAIRSMRERCGDDLVILADLCLDEYTDHGHCGVLDEYGRVDNDATIDLYRRVACAQATAGVDMVAPSGMMDGQVGAIRRGLDEAGFSETGILAYSVKFASSYYGPFREAVNVEIAEGGDRKAYQQDFRNTRESLREVRLDISEGADMVMVKPAGSYLDLLARVAAESEVPVAAYQVSGEYAMVKAAAERGWIDERGIMLEQLIAIKRAGASVMLTYFALDAARAISST